MKTLRKDLKKGLEKRIFNENAFIENIISKQEQIFLDRLKQEYKKTLPNDWNLERIQARNEYLTMRLFCLDCELVSFNDIEAMECEVNQEN